VVAFSGYRVFIYADGAEVQGHGLDLRLERDDFASLEQLQARLGTEVRRILAQELQDT
jgi:hypothetical protein